MAAIIVLWTPKEGPFPQTRQISILPGCLFWLSVSFAVIGVAFVAVHRSITDEIMHVYYAAVSFDMVTDFNKAYVDMCDIQGSRSSDCETFPRLEEDKG